MRSLNERPALDVDLVGKNGNAFSILARVREAMRDAGWTKYEIKEYINEATSDDYNHLLQVTLRYIN